MKNTMEITLSLLILLFSTTSSTENKAVELPEIISSEISLLKTSKNATHILSAIDDFKKIKDKAISSEIFCKSCEVVVDEIIVTRKTGADKNSMAVFLQNLCDVFDKWSSVVCQGFVDIEIDTILYIIDNKRGLTSKRVCAIRFQAKGCTDPEATKWSVDIPPVDKSSKIYPTTQHHEAKSSSLKILHLTDFHYDPLYTPGANADCGDPICCQTSSGLPTSPENAAGFWGAYPICDTPWHLITDFMIYLTSQFKKFDYIYFTGDIISHTGWKTTKTENAAAIRDVLQLFKETFNNTPTYPILGNHESHPCDFFLPINLTNPEISTNWIFDVVATEWERWLPKSAIATVRKGGYYTVLTESGFRIVALNSNVCYMSNFWLFYEDEDPYDQLKWLVRVLSQAEKDGEKVHILSHVPPGDPECLQQWSFQFRRIVNRFAPIIAAQFNGHTHADELRFFYDLNDNRKIVNIAFNGGSFSTFRNNNPNYRIYDVDQNAYSVSDYDHYTFNLTEANLKPGKSPNWYKLYSFKEAYGLENTNYTSLANLVKRMSNDDTLLKKYYRYKVRESDPRMATPCQDATCLQKLLCSIVSVESMSAIQCL